MIWVNILQSSAMKSLSTSTRSVFTVCLSRVVNKTKECITIDIKALKPPTDNFFRKLVSRKY